MKTHEFITKNINKRKSLIIDTHDKIWDYSELAHEEVRSSALLCSILEGEAFQVDKGVCGVQTAFIAKYGSGKPVIGLLGEYDALPNLSQEAGNPVKTPRSQGSPGHGCGHSAIGTGSLAAALAVKAYLDETKNSGTIIYYGCAAEENMGVKPLMARDGYFSNTDCVFAWHPACRNSIPNLRHYATKNVVVEFFGKSAHAAASPHLGRSALDACELMNIGCNYLREHVVSDSRIHYSYVNSGGVANNIVQDYCKMEYGVRALKSKTVKEILERVQNVGRGAALMTDTRVEFSSIWGYSDFFQNSVIAKTLDAAMTEVGPPKWDQDDYKLARKYTESYNDELNNARSEIIKERYPKQMWEEKRENPLDSVLEHYSAEKEIINAGSTDVGDVGYVTPTAYMFITTSTLGAPGHSWYMTGMVGSSIGHKGLFNAAEILALACTKIYENPSLLQSAKEEWREVTGGEYICPMEGDSSTL